MLESVSPLTQYDWDPYENRNLDRDQIPCEDTPESEECFDK